VIPSREESITPGPIRVENRCVALAPDGRVPGELFECLVEEEREVLQEAAELSAS
jgi:hypothetical protein